MGWEKVERGGGGGLSGGGGGANAGGRVDGWVGEWLGNAGYTNNGFSGYSLRAYKNDSRKA